MSSFNIWITAKRGKGCGRYTSHQCSGSESESGSESDPNPDPDPHGFGPPGSGSFYHQAKIVRKTLIVPVLWLLLDFLSFKNDVNVPSKINKQRNFRKKIVFVGLLKVNEENSRIRIRIRIHYSEAWIHGSGSGSTPKCHGSGTLPPAQHYPTKTPDTWYNFQIFLMTTSMCYSHTVLFPSVTRTKLVPNFPTRLPAATTRM